VNVGSQSEADSGTETPALQRKATFAVARACDRSYRKADTPDQTGKV
jgi:hypothetical protein